MTSNRQARLYRDYAAVCTQLAQRAKDRNSKLTLLDTASAWLTLAARHDENSQTTLVYETPEPRQRVAQQQQQAPQGKIESRGSGLL